MGTKGGTSLIRADKILTYIGRVGSATFSEIVAKIELPKSSALVLLEIMIDCGLLVKNDRNKYVLGLKIYELGCQSFHKKNLFEITRRPMQELSIQAGLICHLGVIENHHAIYLDKIECPSSVPTQESWIGKKLTLHATALGKALLAWMRDDEIDHYVNNIYMNRYTDKTITDIPTFKSELLKTKMQGWAIDNEESKDGVICLGAPVFDIYGRVSYAISISGTTETFSVKHRAKYLDCLLNSAKTISYGLGYRKPFI
ncbi:IclR family transcriptional regulator [Tolumonas osonensis]|uniref:DNA-binding IclR family transcriptional regulator n=1 Tax=Tolumonas osonensis TaxID=675874 RepID=A0A841GMI2_9GAMM|nr:IclR family transcriptional regulator [Tolumonas osonensis]MBB6056515.1 DNA-binding IclR family transcriptional regulator [Tolumonas osonensis]